MTAGRHIRIVSLALAVIALSGGGCLRMDQGGAPPPSAPPVIAENSAKKPAADPPSANPAASDPAASASKAPPSKGGAKAASNPAQLLPEKAKFKTEDGSEAFSLKRRDDGAKLVDGADKELARLTIKGRKIKVKDAADKVLGYIVAAEGRLKVEDADQKELFEWQRQADGDWKLKSADEKMIYRIKVREYGFEIETPDDKSVYKIKSKSGKISLRDSADKTKFSSKAAIPSIAVVPLGFDAIESLPLRVALGAAAAMKMAK